MRSKTPTRKRRRSAQKRLFMCIDSIHRSREQGVGRFSPYRLLLAYASSPALYNELRSLDTLGSMVNPGTKIILRTDAAPFRVLVDGPPTLDAKAGSQP